MMKSWYDGYVFPEAGHIYNPKSVVDSIRRKCFASYWTQTETYEALKIYIDLNYDGLKDAIVQMLAGEKIALYYEDGARHTHLRRVRIPANGKLRVSLPAMGGMIIEE